MSKETQEFGLLARRAIQSNLRPRSILLLPILLRGQSKHTFKLHNNLMNQVHVTLLVNVPQQFYMQH